MYPSLDEVRAKFIVDKMLEFKSERVAMNELLDMAIEALKKSDNQEALKHLLAMKYGRYRVKK